MNNNTNPNIDFGINSLITISDYDSVLMEDDLILCDNFKEEIEKDLPHNSSIVEDIYNKLNNTIEMEVTFEDGSTETYDVVVK